MPVQPFNIPTLDFNLGAPTGLGKRPMSQSPGTGQNQTLGDLYKQWRSGYDTAGKNGEFHQPFDQWLLNNQGQATQDQNFATDAGYEDTGTEYQGSGDYGGDFGY